VSEGAEDFRIGDAVFAVCDIGQEGAYAEKIAIKAEIVARKPSSLGHIEAAALAITGLTALVAIEDTLRLKPARQSSFRVAPAAWPASPSSSPGTSVRA
jgi:NADPH:quinone reductase-like Zn-dependent oxidoreductase